MFIWVEAICFQQSRPPPEEIKVVDEIQSSCCAIVVEPGVKGKQPSPFLIASVASWERARYNNPQTRLKESGK